MATTKELRIGNWVGTFKPHKVNAIYLSHFTATDENGLQQNSAQYNLDHIPLTPEILEKCEGFIGKTILGKVFKLHDLMTIVHEENGNIILLHRYFMNETIVRDINLKCSAIKYVHQLQNLYFALTGTELEINLTE